MLILLLRPSFDTLNSTRKYLFIVAFLNEAEKTPILPRLNPMSVFEEKRLVDMMKEKFGYAPPFAQTHHPVAAEIEEQ